MKKAFLFVCAAVMLMLCSCGSMSNTSANPLQTVATGSSAEGQAAGRALNALYTQYKADGKFDYANWNNIINTMTLLQNCQNLKSNAKDSDYWKSFAAGLVMGSNQLITNSTSNTVTNTLSTIMENVGSTKLQEASEDAIQKAAVVKETAGSLVNLFNLFKK